MGCGSSSARGSSGGSEPEALRQLYQRWTAEGRTAIAGEEEHQKQSPIPIPLPMAGYFRRTPTQETTARGQICGPFNEEQAGFFGTTCFGGWNPANRFGQAAMQDAHGGQKDDMRLNNSQFFHHLPSLRSLTCPGGRGGDLFPGGGYRPSPHSVNILEFAPRETSTSEARFSRKRHIANHVYTPPSYSDHIAISLIVPDEVLEALTVKPCGLPAGQTKDTHVWRGKTKSMPRFFSVSEFYSGGICDPETDFNQKSELSESGDPWPACLLRLKSFADLHKLWYVCSRQQVRQCSNTPNNWRNHGRLKKVKLTMKRILTVLSRREIHEQALRAKEILKAQTEREKLETRRFHLEEEQLMLKAKMKRQMKLAGRSDSSSDVDSVARQAWELTLEKNEKELRELLEKLQPLRKATMALLIPDWRYSRKYTDLPGTISWKKQWIRALDESRKLPFRFY
eukprot:g5021.t1